MNISTKAGLVGLVMALATVTANSAIAANTPTESDQTSPKSSVEARLNRISAALRERESQMSEPLAEQVEQLQALWVNGGGGGFLNNTWRNGGWRDGGGFFNNRGGGGFVNRRGGGGFLNRR
jgi:rSAM-associated Gly-rich repeat protein